VKSEEEIIETKKTLKVSGINRPEDRVTSLSKDQFGTHGRPLGSERLRPRYVSDQFSNFFNAYAKTINKAYGRTGSLFEHPFERVCITTEKQFWNVLAYIHQNPQKHGFVKDFRDWKYSSYGLILSGKPAIINREEVMKWFGTKEDYVSLHNQWVTDALAKWFITQDLD